MEYDYKLLVDTSRDRKACSLVKQLALSVSVKMLQGNKSRFVTRSQELKRIIALFYIIYMYIL